MLRLPSFVRLGAAFLGLSLAAILTSSLQACGSSETSSTSSTSGTGGGGSASSASSTTASTGTVLPGDCNICLDTTCATEETACDGECRAVQACLETVCANLSAIGNMEDEGTCQVKCQGEHPDGKTLHLDLVNCAAAAMCTPPCTYYPQDYESCRSFMDKGTCKDDNQACKDSSECQTYKDCVTTCKTLAACIACDDTPSGIAGRKVLEAYELCVAGECTAPAWLP